MCRSAPSVPTLDPRDLVTGCWEPLPQVPAEPLTPVTSWACGSGTGASDPAWADLRCETPYHPFPGDSVFCSERWFWTGSWLGLLEVPGEGASLPTAAPPCSPLFCSPPPICFLLILQTALFFSGRGNVAKKKSYNMFYLLKYLYYLCLLSVTLIICNHNYSACESEA